MTELEQLRTALEHAKYKAQTAQLRADDAEEALDMAERKYERAVEYLQEAKREEWVAMEALVEATQASKKSDGTICGPRG